MAPHLPPIPPQEVEPTIWCEVCKRARSIGRLLIEMIAFFLIILAGRLGEQTIAYATTIDLPWAPHKAEAPVLVDPEKETTPAH